MSSAVIDIGSNTVRMLLSHNSGDARYFRRVTRLAGDFHRDTKSLSSESMERTLLVLEEFSDLLSNYQSQHVKVVGTSALREAANNDDFVAQALLRAGLAIEVISGDREADLSCRGILSVLEPVPDQAILFDIGGGSTEVILVESGKIVMQASVPLGVVRLLEDYATPEHRDIAIKQELGRLFLEPAWNKWLEEGRPVELIGTAGTVTTLAALKLQMVEYDGRRVNNLSLDRRWLSELSTSLMSMSLEERQRLPGMERGRADIILPGLQIVHVLLALADAHVLRVVDAGLLEGLLLEDSFDSVEI